MNKLRAEDLAFLERAPKRWDFEEPVAATPEAVFEAISADPSTVLSLAASMAFAEAVPSLMPIAA